MMSTFCLKCLAKGGWQLLRQSARTSKYTRLFIIPIKCSDILVYYFLTTVNMIHAWLRERKLKVSKIDQCQWEWPKWQTVTSVQVPCPWLVSWIKQLGTSLNLPTNDQLTLTCIWPLDLLAHTGGTVIHDIILKKLLWPTLLNCYWTFATVERGRSRARQWVAPHAAWITIYCCSRPAVWRNCCNEGGVTVGHSTYSQHNNSEDSFEASPHNASESDLNLPCGFQVLVACISQNRPQGFKKVLSKKTEPPPEDGHVFDNASSWAAVNV